jgi:hypothetical protein
VERIWLKISLKSGLKESLTKYSLLGCSITIKIVVIIAGASPHLAFCPVIFPVLVICIK